MVLGSCTNRTVLHGLGTTRIKGVNATIVSPKQTAGADIWFVKEKNKELELVPVKRKLVGTNQIQAAVEELLRGPATDESTTGFASEIPRGTILIGLTKHGNDFDLNLSHRFTTGGGTNSFDTRMEQLRKTVSEVAGKHKVYLSIEGKRLEFAGEGLEVKQPIN
jgi:spore germination protein GerM